MKNGLTETDRTNYRKSKITVIKKSDNPVIVEKKKEEIPF